MANNFDMFTKKGPTNTSENLPYAFSHISSGAPPSVYMSMMTGNTFDEAMQETNNIPMPSEDLDMDLDMDMDIDLSLDPEVNDPDSIEKAIYQLRIAEEKEIEPEEVLETPYGPGLSGEEIDLLLDAYPALDAGVDLDMIDENFDNVDRMLETSGESIEAAMDAAEQRAEDEGEIGAAPAMMKQLGDSLGNSVEAMVNPRNPYEAMLGNSVDPKVPDQAAKYLGQFYANNQLSEKIHPEFYANNQQEEGDEVFGGYANNQQEDNAAISEIILKPGDDNTLMSPNEVVAYLREEGVDPDKIAKWLESPPSEIGQAYLDALSGYVREAPVEASGSAKFDIGKAGGEGDVIGIDGEVDFDFKEEEADLPLGVGRRQLVQENLAKVFYTTMYSYPESGQSDVRDRLPYIFNDTRTLFFLEQGEGAWGTFDKLQRMIDTKTSTEEERNELLGPMEDSYKSFLAQYLTDPASKRSGPAFQEKLGLIASTLKYASENPDKRKPGKEWSDEFERRHTWVEAIFGTSIAPDFGETNRRNLIKMAATQGGQGWYSSLIHRSVDKVMEYYKNIGWPPEKIFERLAVLTGVPWVDPGNKSGPTKIQMEAEAIAEREEDVAMTLGGDLPTEDEYTEEVYGGTSVNGFPPPGDEEVFVPPTDEDDDFPPPTDEYFPPSGEWSGDEEVFVPPTDDVYIPLEEQEDIDTILNQRERPAPIITGLSAKERAERYQKYGPQPEEYEDLFEETSDAPSRSIPAPEPTLPGRVPGVGLTARERADLYRAGYIPGEYPELEPTTDAMTNYGQRDAPILPEQEIGVGLTARERADLYRRNAGLMEDQDLMASWYGASPQSDPYADFRAASEGSLPQYIGGGPEDFAAFAKASNASLPPDVIVDPAILEAIRKGKPWPGSPEDFAAFARASNASMPPRMPIDPGLKKNLRPSYMQPFRRSL